MGLFHKLFGKGKSAPALTPDELKAIASALTLEYRPLGSGKGDDLSWEITGKVNGRSVKLERVRRGSLDVGDSLFLFTVATRNKSGVVGEIGSSDFLTQDPTHHLQSIARPASVVQDPTLHGYILGRFNPESIAPLAITQQFQSEQIRHIGILFETDTVSLFFDFVRPDMERNPAVFPPIMEAAIGLAVHLES